MTLDFHQLVRSRDPEPAQDAALMQTPEKLDIRSQLVMQMFHRHQELHDELLVDFCDAACNLDRSIPRSTPQAYRTARHALVIRGLLKDTGKRAATRAGATAAIWTVAA